VTRHYLVGELSVRLARLEAAAAGQPSLCDVEHLRLEAETATFEGLTWVIMQALALNEQLCWDWLFRGDVAAFERQAEIGADLDEFGVCSRLL
jgi:hypothetical protein